MSMGSALTTLSMRKEGIPGVTVAAMLQKSPSTVVSHPGQGISKFEDLKGRPVAISNFGREDRKSTRLNSSHQIISYAVFCLKKKNSKQPQIEAPRRAST